MRHLGITPGSVSLLALMNDPQGTVEVLIDKEVWAGEAIQVHPLVNTATLVISIKDMELFMEFTGHRFQFIDIA